MFQPIRPVELTKYVRIAFKGDADLMDKYHILQGSLGECVADTVKRIEEIKDPLEYYALVFEEEAIGFTVIGESFLLSFGINIRLREKIIVMDWWRQVCRMLDDKFVTWIFKKNTRTIKFLERNGMYKAAESEQQDFYNLIYTLCPQED